VDGIVGWRVTPVQGTPTHGYCGGWGRSGSSRCHLLPHHAHRPTPRIVLDARAGEAQLREDLIPQAGEKIAAVSAALPCEFGIIRLVSPRPDRKHDFPGRF
jgi:hypothetical protein